MVLQPTFHPEHAPSPRKSITPVGIMQRTGVATRLPRHAHACRAAAAAACARRRRKAAEPRREGGGGVRCPSRGAAAEGSEGTRQHAPSRCPRPPLRYGRRRPRATAAPYARARATPPLMERPADARAFALASLARLSKARSHTVLHQQHFNAPGASRKIASRSLPPAAFERPLKSSQAHLAARPRVRGSAR